MKYKVFIIGPIGDIGGRELESGFISKTLQENDYDIKVVSTINYTADSQIFDFVDQTNVQNINKIICDKNLWFRFLAYLGYLKSNRKKPLSYYVSNAISKKTGLKNFTVKIIKKIIEQSDIIILCVQISSVYVKEIVEYAHIKKKPVVIRTSATINEADRSHKEWLEKVTLFIHHSESNASRLSFLNKHNYKIIDQCTYKENELLKLNPSTTFNNFLYIGRLSSEKGIIEFVNMFKNLNENIHLKIIGDGELANVVCQNIKDLKNIEFLGYLSQQKIIKHIEQSDTIVISSYEESGPLVGVEAMAAARLIISTKVGAMPQRLNGLSNQFWFNIKEQDSLALVVNKLKALSSQEIKAIANENRKHYLANYRKNTLGNLYKNAIFNLVKNQ